MGWKDKFTFRERHFVEHDVCGSKLRFYPNRVGLLHELAEVSKPIAAALASLFADQRNDAAVTDETMVQADTTIRKSTVQAVAPEVLRLRAEERERAIGSMIDAVSDQRNRLLLGRLLMDSLREDFPYDRERSSEQVEEFLYGDGKPDGYPGLDAPALAAMVAGWIKANSKVFGAAGEQIAAAARERLGGPLGRSPSETPSPTDGSNSRTPSSEPSPAASPSTSSSVST